MNNWKQSTKVIVWRFPGEKVCKNVWGVWALQKDRGLCSVWLLQRHEEVWGPKQNQTEVQVSAVWGQGQGEWVFTWNEMFLSLGLQHLAWTYQFVISGPVVQLWNIQPLCAENVACQRRRNCCTWEKGQILPQTQTLLWWLWQRDRTLPAVQGGRTWHQTVAHGKTHTSVLVSQSSASSELFDPVTSFICCADIS